MGGRGGWVGRDKGEKGIMISKDNVAGWKVGTWE